MGRARTPWLWIPSLYFQQGLPVIIIQQVSVILYKTLGIPNDKIGLWTSLITWPWIVKMLWAPKVESLGTKRQWVLATQGAVMVLLAMSALAVTSSHFLQITLILFFVMAFLSATHDIALDGYYMQALHPREQAFFVGIRSAAFRLAMIFGTGGLVVFAGLWEKSGTGTPASWRNALLAGALAYGLLWLYATRVLPRVKADQAIAPGRKSGGWAELPVIEALRTYFRQPQILTVLGFILLYRFGESMLSKMSGPFLLDPISSGGLGLSTSQVGMILGNVGIITLTAGGLLGGIAISRFGLRRCLWPMILSMNLPNLFYIWAAWAQPEPLAVYLLIAVDQFGYGFGLASYAVYLMYVSQGSRYQTSHFALSTGLMALGAMVAGMFSGYLQTWLGYLDFFIAVCLFTVPGMILLRMIPLDEAKLARQKVVVIED